MSKLHFTPITLAMVASRTAVGIAVALHTTWLLGSPTTALANERFGLTPFAANRLMRDLAPQPLPNQWQQKVDRGIQCLLESNKASSETCPKNEPSLENRVNIQEELNRIPQLQPNPQNPPSVER